MFSCKVRSALREGEGRDGSGYRIYFNSEEKEFAQGGRNIRLCRVAQSACARGHIIIHDAGYHYLEHEVGVILKEI